MGIAIRLMDPSSNSYGTNVIPGIELLERIDGRWPIQQKAR
jgi:hypothetical protein